MRRRILFTIFALFCIGCILIGCTGEITVHQAVETQKAQGLWDEPTPNIGNVATLEPTIEGLAIEPSEDCPDPAVVSLSAEILSHSPEWSDTQGEVEIVGVVRNLGGAAFESNPGRQELVLYQGDSTRDLEPIQRQTFQNLAPDEEVQITYRREWDAASPAEGEFPPIYTLSILYDPDITLDGNENNDDCDSDNNTLEMDGDEINRLFTERST